MVVDKSKIDNWPSASFFVIGQWIYKSYIWL